MLRTFDSDRKTPGVRILSVDNAWTAAYKAASAGSMQHFEIVRAKMLLVPADLHACLGLFGAQQFGCAVMLYFCGLCLTPNTVYGQWRNGEAISSTSNDKKEKTLTASERYFKRFLWLVPSLDATGEQ